MHVLEQKSIMCTQCVMVFGAHLLVHLEHLLLAGVQGGAQVAVRHLQILFLVGLLASRLQGLTAAISTSTESRRAGLISA